MSHSLVTFHLIWLVFLLLPSTNYSEWGHISLTSGHYYPVIMCCSAWLHLLFLIDSLMLEESNFTWWMIIRLGEAISASCLTSELCTTKSHRCLNQLPTIPAFSNQLYTLGIIARGVRTFRLFDFSPSCAWRSSITPVFACLLKSNRVPVFTLQCCHEKLLTSF